MIWGLQMGMRAPKREHVWDPADAAIPRVSAQEPLGCEWGMGMQEVIITKSARIWPQIAEVHMKGLNSVSPETWIFPYIED